MSRLAATVKTVMGKRGMTMNTKAIKLITVLTVMCTVFVCIGTVCSDAASRPGRVKDFKAKASDTSVKLSWARAGGRVSNYVIYRDGRKIASVGRKTLKYTDKNRKYGKSYKYKVRAYRKDARLYGSWSATRKAVIRPGKVSGLEYSGTYSDQIPLSWKKANGAEGYAVYRDGKLAARTKDTSYTDTGLMKNTEYEYYIKSYVKNGKKYVYGESSKKLKAVTAGFPPGDDYLVDVHCAQTAKDNCSYDDLGFLVDLIVNRLQPQAVEMIINSFPDLITAQEMEHIGKDLSLYIYYKNGDNDGDPFHEIKEPSIVQVIGRVEKIFDGSDRFKYMLAVDVSCLCTKTDPASGEKLIDHEGESVELLKNRLAGEMLRAVMFDYNRIGMIGAVRSSDALRNDDGSFPTEEAAEMYVQAVYPKWFTEGIIAAVENVFLSENDQFQKLRNSEDPDLFDNYVKEGKDFDLENNVLTYDSIESCRASGYLAVLYLAELQLLRDGTGSIDESGAFSAEKLCRGLSTILFRMHGGETLDQIIYDISPIDDRGYKLYLDTEGFEKCFIKGQLEYQSEDNYLRDDESIEYVTALLDYLESGRTTDGKPYGGSVLTDLKENRSPLDAAKEQSCDILHIDERMDPLESTVPDDVALSGGGRSVTGS